MLRTPDIDFEHPQNVAARPPARTSKVTSVTRTTLRPFTSMICWSSRSRPMRSMYSSEWYGESFSSLRWMPSSEMERIWS